ncbi:helix-turn-helix domain-containing protein [Mucilaginibacter aquaedulcis]|uniref:helix-turn-helix domain-containing protein n=1 Tax=Mucilaginibacter aquaedulcis TaxID=1187081 RepID=UPI0025B3B0C7|nr:helix-turn-helix transcriptional regulator [Mucilaginibacter aquaedulcis]MDN3551578.1 helix-turn-helix transcriptional regulator [Mucilaginibacter aquaedulcis]
MSESTLHIGRKISKLRELRGMKQEALAAALGISQQAISKIEQSPDVEEDALQKIANVLGIPSEAIKNFTEEAVFNYFNNFHDNSSGFNYNCTFNPIDKIVELYNEKVALLERLLQAEKEKNELLSKK